MGPNCGHLCDLNKYTVLAQPSKWNLVGSLRRRVETVIAAKGGCHLQFLKGLGMEGHLSSIHGIHYKVYYKVPALYCDWRVGADVLTEADIYFLNLLIAKNVHKKIIQYISHLANSWVKSYSVALINTVRIKNLLSAPPVSYVKVQQ